jgi:excisionase family DNA binding protein
MRVADLAKRWNCSDGKIRAMIRAGEFPVLRLGNMLRIPVTAVIAFEAHQCQQQPTDPDFAASPAAIPGISITPAVASLRAARIARRGVSPHKLSDRNGQAAARRAVPA